MPKPTTARPPPSPTTSAPVSTSGQCASKDPIKDYMADQIAVRSGFMTLPEAMASRGFDAEDTVFGGKREHHDTVIAVALAVWWAERVLERATITEDFGANENGGS